MIPHTARALAMTLLLTATHTAAQTASSASAPAYPTKPVRIIIPSSTGGAVDGLARIVAQIGPALGQQVIADNRPGANGTIGMELTAKAPPDGHTIVLGFLGPLAVTHAMAMTGIAGSSGLPLKHNLIRGLCG